MVQLKGVAGIRVCKEWVYFNSSMVQLKAKEFSTSDIARRIFQFLYGTIKSAILKISILLDKSFQFLYGTIKRIISITCPVLVTVFQFLYGTIKSSTV